MYRMAELYGPESTLVHVRLRDHGVLNNIQL